MALMYPRHYLLNGLDELEEIWRQSRRKTEEGEKKEEPAVTAEPGLAPATQAPQNREATAEEEEEVTTMSGFDGGAMDSVEAEITEAVEGFSTVWAQNDLTELQSLVGRAAKLEERRAGCLEQDDEADEGSPRSVSGEGAEDGNDDGAGAKTTTAAGASATAQTGSRDAATSSHPQVTFASEATVIDANSPPPPPEEEDDMEMDISNGGTEEHNDERNGNDSSSDDGEADDERTNDGNGRPSPNRRQQISAARGRARHPAFDAFASSSRLRPRGRLICSSSTGNSSAGGTMAESGPTPAPDQMEEAIVVDGSSSSSPPDMSIQVSSPSSGFYLSREGSPEL